MTEGRKIMAIIKCKMCGGVLDIREDMTIAECEYCGTKQTLPQINNEQILNMLNRANYLRQQCEFDRAAEIYEKVASRVDNDAEIYWSMVLCRYGIEYVDDPVTNKKVPTCHRTQYESILKDADYLQALKYADGVQKSLYEKEAVYIDSILKKALEISNKEKPFDVFICYKENDEEGNRTPDSVLAQEIYYQLTDEGFKVFFSRITLEDKLGTAYEPYIFAALNSAKVMVVVGTCHEYINSVWVKNEWSRFIKLMQNNKNKALIPAYRDMDPYDLPDELSMFQAQDMSKLGFMQDLVRGIKKIINSGSEAEQENIRGNAYAETLKTVTYSIEPLLKRTFMFLEDGEWERADDFCERILNIEPECGEAYLGKLMAKLKINKKSDFDTNSVVFDNEPLYDKILRFGSDKLKEEVKNYSKLSYYNVYIEKMSKAEDDREYMGCYENFMKISDVKDAKGLAKECRQKAVEYQRNYIENQMKSIFNSDENKKSKEAARKHYDSIYADGGLKQKIASFIDIEENRDFIKNSLMELAREEKKLSIIIKYDDIRRVDDGFELMKELEKCTDPKDMSEIDKYIGKTKKKIRNMMETNHNNIKYFDDGYKLIRELGNSDATVDKSVIDEYLTKTREKIENMLEASFYKCYNEGRCYAFLDNLQMCKASGISDKILDEYIDKTNLKIKEIQKNERMLQYIRIAVVSGIIFFIVILFVILGQM